MEIMPDLGITEIAALASIIGAGTSVGLGVKSLVDTPGAPKPPDTTAATAAASTQEKEAIARQAPDLQQQLGGAVAPDYYAALAEKNAGYAGDSNQGRDALSTFFGGSTPTSLTGPGSTAPGGSGGKNIFEDLIAQSGGGGGDDKGASGGFTGV
jgi:hypothetical protein